MASLEQQGSPRLAASALARLGVALALSLAFHLSLILGLQVRPATIADSRQFVIEARLMQPAVTPPAAPAAIKAEVPEVQPARPQPKPEPKSKPEAARNAPAPSAPAPPRSALPAIDVPMIEDPTYYPAKQLDVLPLPLQPIKPKYPPAADVANVGGQVKLLILIDEQGVVRDISVVEVKPEGYGFEESAMEAFRNARFNPAVRKGRPVKSRGIFAVTFEAGEK
jgi:protein TonB